MKLNDFIKQLKLAHDVPNYYNNHYPKNLGYYDGTRFSFDCWNMIKVILSGWTDNYTKGYYIPTSQLVTGDIDGLTMLKKCSGRSKDFSQLKQPGTYLYIYKSPHAGIYLGDFEYQGHIFNVVECTGAWASKVQYTYVDENGGRYLYKGGQRSPYNWEEYGLLPWVEYAQPQPLPEVKLPGIDVSRYQGLIDWTEVINSGIRFAIIKAGGSDAGRYKDSCFETNYQNARAAGMKIGCYYIHGKGFTSASAGIADAQHFLSLISGKQFDYPCFSDLELPSSITKVGNTDAVIAFCDQIIAAGFKTGIYASDISGFKERLQLERLTRYDKWVARYGSAPSYVGDYQMWQYSSQGNVKGISGRCDMDISLKDYSDNPTPVYFLWGADFTPVFNPTYYANHYADLEEAFGHDESALWCHFVTFGMNEARQASENFDVQIYKNRYEDLQKAYGDNLPMYYWHYCYFGINEGRSGI